MDTEQNTEGADDLGVDVLTMMDAIMEVSEGNPGALTVLVGFAQNAPDVAALLIRYLYDFGPKGSELWTLYKDEFGEDIQATVEELLIRALKAYDTSLEDKGNPE